MKIIVTGSEGSLMQAVIPNLLKSGHTVVGIDNLYRHNRIGSKAGIDYEFYQQDLIDRQKVIELTKGADAIIHAAAKIYGVIGLGAYRADILGDDTAICSNVLQACVANNINKFIYISSSMVYENCVQDINVPLTESMTDNCLMPHTDYGLSKLVCERMVKAFQGQYGIDYTIWRPFNIVNPYEQGDKEIGFSHVLPDFVTNIVVKKLNPLPIVGDGQQIRCFTWIDDVSTVISNYSFDQRSKNQTFNICNVEPVTMLQAAKMIYQTIGNDPDSLEFRTVKSYEHDVRVRIPSVEKLQRTLGPFEFVDTKESIRRCVKDLISN